MPGFFQGLRGLSTRLFWLRGYITLAKHEIPKPPCGDVQCVAGADLCGRLIDDVLADGGRVRQREGERAPQNCFSHLTTMSRRIRPIGR